MLDAAPRAFSKDFQNSPPPFLTPHTSQPPALPPSKVSHNYLSGAVSDEIAGLKALRLFHIEGNRHSGAEKALITECIKTYLPGLVRNQGFRI